MRGPHEQYLAVNNISLNNGEEKINITNPNLTCQKLARFIFPKSDPVIDPSWASETDLLGVYQNDPNLLIGYLNLARGLNISRARKKKMGKFKAEICRKKIPALWPLRERIWVLSQCLQRGEEIEKNSL